MTKKIRTVNVKYLCMIVIFFVLCVSGCGNKTITEDSIKGPQKEQLEVYDLESEQWKKYLSIEKTDEQWAVTTYLDNFARTTDSNWKKGERFTAVAKDICYYIQHSYSVEDTQMVYKYDMFTVNTTNMEMGEVDLTFQGNDVLTEEDEIIVEELSKKAKQGYARIVDVDATDSFLYALIGMWDEEWCLNNCYVLEMNFTGEITHLADMGEVLCHEEKETHNDTLSTKLMSDGNHLYLLDIENARIVVADRDGSAKTIVEVPDCDSLSLRGTCKSINGLPIYEYRNNAGNIVVFAMHGEERKELYNGEGENVSLRYADAYGKVYYLNSKHLLCWDIAKGECKSLYDIDGFGFTECGEILMNSLGEIIMMFEDGGEECLYKLSKDKDNAQIEINLLQYFSDEYTKNCAAEYTRTHPGINIVVSEAGDMLLNRTVEQMKNGNGPDMLLINRKQLLSLKEAECLLLLSGALSEELQEQMFRGAIQYGTIKDELYGVACEASIGTLLVADDVWKKGTWTIQEALDLLKEKERNGSMPERFASIYYNATAEQLLYDLCLQDIENSSFVDMQKKTCAFDVEEFYSLLKLCKVLGEEQSNRYLSFEEQREEVLNGKALTYYAGGGLLEFTNDREAFGEDFHCVGYPTNSGNSGLVHCYRCIAVNKWTENAEIINDFIQFMLSEENQIKYTTYWVRRDVILNNVYENTELSERPVLMMDGYSYAELGSCDGSMAYVDEYIQLMDGSHLLSSAYEIQNIVMEEAQKYFAGDKTEKETVTVIQSRVTLYLEENM